jgi:hypothetical protein
VPSRRFKSTIATSTGSAHNWRTASVSYLRTR